MAARRSLKFPITLGVIMIILVVLLTTGWVLLSVFAAGNSSVKAVYWVLLIVGSLLFVFMLVGVVMYLALSIKAINLTRRQSNFMDSVSHELKSPIASLKLYLQTLTMRQLTHDEQQAFYRFMLDDVARLDDLINHLLDAARLDHPEESKPTEWISLHALLNACADDVRSRYQIKPDQIQILGEDGEIRARHFELDMIFRNLIDNAVKYGGDPAQVEIHTCWLGGKKPVLVTRIADNGKGIPASQRRKIFQRFERLGVELERTKPGTGLGLYIVGTLIKRLRGTVRVLSKAKESGTVFEVAFPARPMGDSPSPDIRDPVTTNPQSD